MVVDTVALPVSGPEPALANVARVQTKVGAATLVGQRVQRDMEGRVERVYLDAVLGRVEVALHRGSGGCDDGTGTRAIYN